MSIQAFASLCCPLDGGPLQREERRWHCANGHSFDCASEGYVNLLPVQNKRSKDPGDSKQMVAARRLFLNAGYYQPIAAAVAQAVLASSSAARMLTCLDAGCGEGYYLRQLCEFAQEEQALALMGLDISKWAIQVAAKQDKRASWVVASNANIPVSSASLDRVLCLFGFPVYAEFARVLKPAGMLIMADPGPGHLRELRELLYPMLKPAKEADDGVPVDFKLCAVHSVNYRLVLNSAESIAALLSMTPHLYRANAQGRERVAALTRIELEIDVKIRCLQRKTVDA